MKSKIVGNFLLSGSIVIVSVVGLFTVQTNATVGPNINLSKMTGYQGETTIAIDPSNPNRMFASSNISTVGLFAAYSTDGGTTWQYTDPTDKTIADGDAGDPLTAACCDPIAVFDRFGNLYLTYLTNSPVNVVVGVSTNGGASFTGLTLAGGSPIIGTFPLDKTEPGQMHRRYDNSEGTKERSEEDILNTGGDQPTVAVGPSDVAGQDAIWVVWNSGSAIRAIGTRSTGLGAITPFSGTGTVVPTGGQFGDIEVGPTGQVMVTDQSSVSSGPSNIRISVDPDGLGPLLFEPPVFVTTTKKNYPWINTNDVFGAAVTVGTTNVGTFDAITPQNSRTVDAETDLSWDRSGGFYNGRVYLAYTEEVTNESNNTDVMVRFSDNNGATWSAPVKVNDDATTRAQFFQRVEVDQTTGTVALAWYDCRNDAAGTDAVANTEAEVYGATSFSGGTAFNVNEKISAGSSRAASFANGNEYGDYNGLAFRNNKYFYIWADNSNSTADNANGTRSAPDIYTAKVTLTPTAAGVSLSGRVLTSNGSGLRNAVISLTDTTGVSRTVTTSAFGYYRFDDVAVGGTYVVSVASKRFTFVPRTLIVVDELSDLDFVAQ